mmetsp:Transcript_143116/g.249566  ORF Transcript_143116/g.249566 Transcript_143116/m.249566 type:complete len:120 (-) Transcript_143116:66-425(-)
MTFLFLGFLLLASGHAVYEEEGFEEGFEEDDVSMFVQSAVSVDSGTRHVGTGCVTSSDDEAACLAQFHDEDEEGIEDGGDILSYMQSEVGIEVGVRQVGTAEPIIGTDAPYYTEDVMSL